MAELFSTHYQVEDANGLPEAGAKLYFYEAGTTTPVTVYQDAGAATPHANPVVASSSGTFPPIYAAVGSYKTVLKDSADVTIQTVDNITVYDEFVGDSGSGGSVGLVPAPAAGDAADEKYLKASGQWASPFPYRIVAGILRPNGSGVWSVLDDSDHSPVNITGISQNSISITITYPTASKVVTFVAVPDETIALARIHVGASVGFSSAAIQMADNTDSPLDPADIVNTLSNIWIFGLFLP